MIPGNQKEAQTRADEVIANGMKISTEDSSEIVNPVLEYLIAKLPLSGQKEVSTSDNEPQLIDNESEEDSSVICKDLLENLISNFPHFAEGIKLQTKRNATPKSMCVVELQRLQFGETSSSSEDISGDKASGSSFHPGSGEDKEDNLVFKSTEKGNGIHIKLRLSDFPYNLCVKVLISSVFVKSTNIRCV